MYKNLNTTLSQSINTSSSEFPLECLIIVFVAIQLLLIIIDRLLHGYLSLRPTDFIIFFWMSSIPFKGFLDSFWNWRRSRKMVSLRLEAVFVGYVCQGYWSSIIGCILDWTLDIWTFIFCSLVFDLALFLGLDAVATFKTKNKRIIL